MLGASSGVESGFFEFEGEGFFGNLEKAGEGVDYFFTFLGEAGVDEVESFFEVFWGDFGFGVGCDFD